MAWEVSRSLAGSRCRGVPGWQSEVRRTGGGQLRELPGVLGTGAWGDVAYLKR